MWKDDFTSRDEEVKSNFVTIHKTVLAAQGVSDELVALD
jgi:hypothetical protein